MSAFTESIDEQACLKQLETLELTEDVNPPVALA